MKRHLPNAITCCNLISGCIATYHAFFGWYQYALIFIIIGAIFDFFDGMTARLLNVSSPIGKELDSLADDITFGLAPSVMVFSFCGFMMPPLGLERYLPYAAFIMAAFSALRLAKFNLDERQTTQFIGLPTPANALFWAALLASEGEWLSNHDDSPLLLLLLSFISSYLLISEIPMFALKFKHWGWQGNQWRYLFIITSIPLLLLFQVRGIWMVIAWYIVLSVLSNIFERNRPQTA